MSVLKLNLFGAFQAESGSATAETISFRSDKIRALLAYLAVENGRPHRRDSLAALLWPDYPDADARHNLRNSLYRLRRSFDADLSDDLFTIDRQNVQLQTDSLQLDIARFTSLLSECAGHQHQARQNCVNCIERLQKAADLYRGELLAGFSLSDAAPFEEWSLIYRERFHQQVLAALYDLATFHKQQGQYELARKYAARQVALEPWREAGHRQMMQALALSGHIDDALAQFESCRRILAQELDAEPAPETIALYEQIRDNQAAAQPFSSTVIEQAGATTKPAYHLPRQFTRFIGRRAEINAIIEQLADPACALLTITGPGGMGKTRLAIEAARQQIDSFKHGVWFVSLASVQSVDDVPAAIAAGLPLPPFSSADIERQLLNYLSNKQLLLVIDNFEHLLGSAGVLLTLLQKAPQVKILTTSRERLNLQIEWVFEIQGLALASQTGFDSPLEDNPASQLFIQHLQRIRHQVVLTEQDVEQIDRICRLVEGVPLAIELATNLATTRSFSEISELIANDLNRLETRSRDVPERQRSLRAVFEYSWSLLNKQEQQALRKIAIFPATFSTQAAKEVTGTSRDILTALLEKSFLRRGENGRHGMHVLLRQFAREKLVEASTKQLLQTLKQRHSSYYLTWLQERETTLDNLSAKPALKEIQQEIDNIRPAWSEAVACSDKQAIAQSSPALFKFLNLSGQSREADRLLDLAFNSLGDISPGKAASKKQTPAQLEKHRLAANILNQRVRFMLDLSKFDEAIVLIKQAVEQGQLAGDIDAVLQARNHWVTYFWRQGLYKAAQEQSEHTFQLSQQSQNGQLKIWAIIQQGIIHNHLGEYDLAQQAYEQALRDYQEIDIKDSTWIRLHNALGSNFILQDRYNKAREYYELALDLYRQIDSLPGRALIISNLSTLDLYEQRYNQALLQAERSLAMFQEIGEVVRVSQVNITLGIIFTCLGAWETARQKLKRSLTLSRSVHNQLTVIDSLVNLALLDCQLGNFEEALEMGDQALALAKEAAVRSHQAYALTSQGWALMGLGQLEGALTSFQQALAIRQELKQLNLTAEVEANLARLYLKQNDMKQASAYVERVMTYIQLPKQENATATDGRNGPSIRQLKGIQDPFQVYLICYHVLQANGDDRSLAILEFAATLLKEQANLLDDASFKGSFLENVPANHQILSYYR